MNKLKRFLGKRRIPIAIALVVALLVMLVPISVDVNPPAESIGDRTLILGQNQIVLTIGTEVYAAGSVDYTCDGTDDDVQFQLALDALPTAGGELVVLAGNYSFSAAVSRAINNVTIQGVGRASYVARDGVNPCFDVDVQTDWVFRDMRFDAGGVDIATATDYTLQNVYFGTDYYAYRTDYMTGGTEYPTGRTATFTVAASDSSASSKAQADYVCDGTADNVEIQAAITALPATGGKIVLLGGTYSVSSAITVNKEVTLEGQSAGSTILNNVNVAGANLLEVPDVSKVARVIRNLQFKGNVASGHGIYLTGSGVSVENCYIYDHGGYGLYFADLSHYHKIANCYICSNDGGGAYLEDANFNSFFNCNFDWNHNYAVNIQKGTHGVVDVNFYHCSFEINYQMAVNLNEVSFINFQGCWFEANSQVSGDENILITACHGITFRECVLPGVNTDSTALSGIHLDNSKDVKIEHSRVFGYSWAAPPALLVEANCGRNYFTKNMLDYVTIDDKSYKLVVADNDLYTSIGYVGFPASAAMSCSRAIIDSSITNMCIDSSHTKAHYLATGGTTPPVVAQETADGWFDDYSAKITFPAGADTGFVGSRVGRSLANITTDKYYVVSFYLKADSSLYSLSIKASGIATIGDFYIHSPPTEWTKFVLISKKAGATGLEYLYVYVVDSPAGDLDVWIDDIQQFEFDDINDRVKYGNVAASIYIPTGDVARTLNPAVNEPTRFSDLFMDVLAASANYIVNAQNLVNGAVALTGTQPTYSRGLDCTITEVGGNVTDYTMTVVGINAKGQTITDIFTFTDDGLTFSSDNAFDHVASVTLADVVDTGNATFVMGIDTRLGLKNPIYGTSDVWKIIKNGTKQTVATVQVDVDYGIYDMSVITLAATDDFEIWYQTNLNIID